MRNNSLPELRRVTRLGHTDTDTSANLFGRVEYGRSEKNCSHNRLLVVRCVAAFAHHRPLTLNLRTAEQSALGKGRLAQCLQQVFHSVLGKERSYHLAGSG